MPARFSLVLALILSLFAAPAAQRTAAGSIGIFAADCAKSRCAGGCGPAAACCARRGEEHPQQPAGAPAPSRAGHDFTLVAAHTISVLHALAALEPRFVISGKAPVRHALPPLAASCVRLI